MQGQNIFLVVLLGFRCGSKHGNSFVAFCTDVFTVRNNLINLVLFLCIGGHQACFACSNSQTSCRLGKDFAIHLEHGNIGCTVSTYFSPNRCLESSWRESSGANIFKFNSTSGKSVANLLASAVSCVVMKFCHSLVLVFFNFEFFDLGFWKFRDWSFL